MKNSFDKSSKNNEFDEFKIDFRKYKSKITENNEKPSKLNNYCNLEPPQLSKEDFNKILSFNEKYLNSENVSNKNVLDENVLDENILDENILTNSQNGGNNTESNISMRTVLEDLIRYINENPGFSSIVIFLKFPIQDPLPANHYRCIGDPTKMVAICIEIIPNQYIQMLTGTRVIKIRHPDNNDLIDMQLTRAATQTHYRPVRLVNPRPRFTYSQASIYNGTDYQDDDIMRLLPNVLFDINNFVDRIFCYEMNLEMVDLISLDNYALGNAVSDYIHQDLVERFTFFTDAAGVRIPNINIVQNDISQMTCYTDTWDTYINPKIGQYVVPNPQTDAEKLQSLITGPLNCMRRDPAPAGTTDAQRVERELEYKIAYYRYVFGTKAKISTRDGVYSHYIPAPGFTNIVWRGMARRYNTLDPAGTGMYLLRNFTSASIEINVAQGFIAGIANAVIYEFTIHPCVPYIAYDGTPFISEIPREREILFCGDCCILITGDPNGQIRADGYRYIQAELMCADIARIANCHTELTSQKYIANSIDIRTCHTIYEFPPTNPRHMIFPNPHGTRYWGGNYIHKLKRKTKRRKTKRRKTKRRNTKRRKTKRRKTKRVKASS